MNELLDDPSKNRVDFWYENPYDFIPGISIDCVIFGFSKGEMRVLLGKIKNFDKWMLPGGFLHKSEDIEEAAQNILAFRTGLKEIYLRQFYSFGKADRTHSKENEELYKVLVENIKEEGKSWYKDRFITFGYYAFVNYDEVKLIKNEDNKHEELKWFYLKDIPELFADHQDIVNKALEELRNYIFSFPFGLELLPEKFTMTDLRTVYEAILERKLDRRNFQRKIIASRYIIKLDELLYKHGVKPANLFRFDIDRYHEGYFIE